MVRRLKQRAAADGDGTPALPEARVSMPRGRLPRRRARTRTRRSSHYAQPRGERRHGDARRALAADFVLTLLKKRLFSSPAAFAATLDVHRDDDRPRATPSGPPPTRRRRGRCPRSACSSGSTRTRRGRRGVRRGGRRRGARPPPRSRAAAVRPPRSALLDRLIALGASARSDRPDAQATRLLDWLDEHRPGRAGDWNDERVIVFTEYRDTQR